MSINRREFLQRTTVAAAAGLVSGVTTPALSGAESRNAPLPIPSLIDCNVTLSRWPFRRLPLDQTPKLVAKLRSAKVTEAWAGTFESVFHKDIGAANARLAEECRQYGRGVLVPFGSINPSRPGWREDFERCWREYRMPGIRLHPNYHGYKLDEPGLAELLDRASERGLIVQLALSLEDERTHSPLMRVAQVETAPLAALVKARPRLRLVILNWFRSLKDEALKQLVTAGEVYFDVATVEGVGGIGTALQDTARLVFGSHAPFFYFESAKLKLIESALTKEQLRSVCTGNAQQLKQRR